MKVLQNKFAAFLLIVSITFIVFRPSLSNELVNWDDPDYVLDNSLIADLSLPHIKLIFSSFKMGNYHPLTVISYKLDYLISGIKPYGYHLINLLLHMLNVLLVWQIIKFLTKDYWMPFVIALLFAIHPMHVESVAWISERKDLLYSFFYFLTILVYIQNINSKSIGKYIILLLFFILSLLSKAQAVTLPIALLLIDYFYNKKIELKDILYKIPFLILSLIFGIIAIYAQQSEEALLSTKTLNIFDRLVFSTYGVQMYLLKFLLPFNLSALYPYPQTDSLPVYFYSGLISLILLIAVLYKFKWQRNKWILLGTMFFIINIILVSQLIAYGSIYMAERYTYVSYLGLCMVFIPVLDRFRQHLYINGMILIVIVIYGFITYNRTFAWKDSISLWSDVIDKFPDSETAYLNRGEAYQTLGKPDQAVSDWTKLISLNPKHFKAYYDRGNIFLSKHEYDLAIKDYSAAIDIKGDFYQAYNNRGKAYSLSGNQNKAINNYDKAIQLVANYGKAYYNRGYAYYLNQDFNAAIQDLNKAILFEPTLNAYLVRGNSYYTLSQFSEAIDDYSRIINIDSGYVNAYYNRANVYIDLNQKGKALSDLLIAEKLYVQKGEIDNANRIKRLIEHIN